MRPRRDYVASLFLLSIFLAPSCGLGVAAAQDLSAKQVDFFETKIRPVLVAKCYECHSAEGKSIQGGLRLDSPEAMREGGESGHAIVPGRVVDSLILSAMRYEDFEMPPSGKLSEDVIADFEKWITDGAADPRQEPSGKTEVSGGKANTTAARLWSLEPVQAVIPPVPLDAQWRRTSVDRFLQVARERSDTPAVGQADPATLLRRVYFDLVGLPPPVNQLQAFLENPSDAALESIIDELLASPQFGERWARHWLDVVRYAESAGSSRDVLMLYAWRYRDFVIESLNEDLPYDEFLRWQVAGDLSPADSHEQRQRQQIATGLLAIGSKSLNGGNLTLDIADDQIDVICRAFLGLTVSCARCHDHKYDPIPTRDYYALAGIFRNTETLYGGGTKRPKNDNEKKKVYLQLPGGPLADGINPEDIETQLSAKRKTKSTAQKRIRSREKQLPKDWRELSQKLETETRELSSEERLIVTRSKDLRKQLATVSELDNEIQELEGKLPPTEYALGVRDKKGAKDWPIQVGGDKANNGDVVPRGFLTCVSLEVESPSTDSSGRLELSQWLTHPRNPLTSRVIVNRVWQHLFGQGLVASVDNFGVTGQPPSHPELLDFLAHRFVVVHEWSIKSLIRELVLTDSYQLSGDLDEQCYARDPGNRWLWRHNRLRLEAEPLRDAMLAMTGELQLTPFQGSLVQEIGEGEVGRNINTECLDRPFPYRSVYLPVIRGIVPEFLKIFDMPEPSNVQGQRDVTNVPAQALFMLNSPFVLDQATKLADRLLEMELADVERVELLFMKTVSRLPTDAEEKTALDFLTASSTASDETMREQWISLSHAMFARAEFRYLD